MIIEIPLICHEYYPNLVLRIKVEIIEDIEDILAHISGLVQGMNRENEEKVLNKMWSDGMAVYRDFDSHGKLQSLEQAILKFELVAEKTLENHSSIPQIFSNLGTFLCRRFEELRKVADLNNAIERLKMAVSLAPDEDPEKPKHLNSLGISPEAL
jgi:hypothetical protein